ncbi:uncharacterized protein BDW43DRAFT_284160 [Aspergillus alliaceus]|uniref:uncharacterized protein n=1 Tax=Petromyces alliaceus TaxID=209559 RepID=UPI0012A6C63C|nr:uncharacterized protein BDW43DRAFT_284160 [Aspergillus alliaceus]KAB8230864.1 hypothetical protein BDW43DRAFT_284160 [Aspergillus alliaceus]
MQGSSSSSTMILDPEYSKFPFTRPNGDELPAEFHRLLRECPVSRAEFWDGSHPWLVVKHKDVCDMLIYPRLSKVQPGSNICSVYVRS